jgi:hypothetical protein
MRVVVVYKEQTDYARTVIDYFRDFKQQTTHDLEAMDPESPAGISFCETYDITQFPTMIAIADDGTLQNMWVGLPFPTISEVSYYVQ